MSPIWSILLRNMKFTLLQKFTIIHNLYSQKYCKEFFTNQFAKVYMATVHGVQLVYVYVERL
jgi:hypothetical protein